MHVFSITILILMQNEFVVGISRELRIQELLVNSTFPADGHAFLSKVSRGCRKQMKTWQEDLKLLKQGICRGNACDASLDQLDAFARYPTAGYANIAEGSYRQCVEGQKGEVAERDYCYLIHGNEAKSCQNDYHSVLYEPNRTAFAICAPMNCSETELQLIFSDFVKHFKFMMHTPICGVFCATRTVSDSHKKSYYIFTCFVVFLTTLVFVTSLYDYVREARYRLISENEPDFLQRVILAWSLWSNVVFLFKDNRKGYIRSLDCIRAVTFTWVVGQNVVAHLGFYGKAHSSVRVDPEKMSFSGSFLSSLLPVYTYLFMSGLTASYTFIRAKQPLEVVNRPLTWLVFYFHRWIRLTCALMVFIGFFFAYGKYIRGPYDALTGYSMINQTEQCTFWKDFLHISNFDLVDKMCYLPAWHLAVDFQLTLIAPVFMIAFYFSSRIGTILSLGGCVVCSSLTLFFFYQKRDEKLQSSAFTGDHRHDDVLIETILSKAWNQMTPYLMGMIAGYYLAVCAVSKRVLHPLASGFLWIFVAGVALTAIFFGNHGTAWYEKGLINVAVRIVWSLCLAWLVVSTHLKWAGPIGNFMEHQFWRPFGKLSYCAFIVHHMVLYHVLNMEDRAPKFVSFWREQFHFTIPIVIYSYFGALFLGLLVEIPMIRLDKILLDKVIPPPPEEVKDDEEVGEEEDVKREGYDEADGEECDSESEPVLLNYEY